MGGGNAFRMGEPMRPSASTTTSKRESQLKGTRTTYYTHLEPWEAEPGGIQRKGPPLPEECRVYRETKAKKRFKARLALLRAMSPDKNATTLFEAPSPSAARVADDAAALGGPPSPAVSAPTPAPAPCSGPGAREEQQTSAAGRCGPSARQGVDRRRAREEQWRPASRQQKKPEKWPGAYTVETVHGTARGTRQTRAPGPSETHRTSAQER